MIGDIESEPLGFSYDVALPDGRRYGVIGERFYKVRRGRRSPLFVSPSYVTRLDVGDAVHHWDDVPILDRQAIRQAINAKEAK